MALLLKKKVDLNTLYYQHHFTDLGMSSFVRTYFDCSRGKVLISYLAVVTIVPALAVDDTTAWRVVMVLVTPLALQALPPVMPAAVRIKAKTTPPTLTLVLALAAQLAFGTV